MASELNVLLVVWDGGGNVPPLLGIGRELVRRGHRVRCLGPERLRSAVERQGMTFRHAENAFPFDPTARLSIDESQRQQGVVFLGDGYGKDVEAEIARDEPEMALVDCFLVAALATCEKMGVRPAVLMHTLPSWFVPFWDRHLLRPTNDMREQMGLRPVASVADAWTRASRVLVTSTSLLDPGATAWTRLPNLRFVGLPELPAEQRAAQLPEMGTEPLVLVAFSTTAMGQEEALANVIRALERLPLRALVTTGRSVDAAALPNAANVEVRTWARHSDVLQRASLVVTHAGHGSVMTALTHGVPLLCMPLGRDQEFIAGRVEALGLGRCLSADSPPDAIAEAVTDVLRSPAFRTAAGRAAQEVGAAGDGAANAATELEITTF